MSQLGLGVTNSTSTVKVENRFQLQRFRERHFGRDVLLSASHGHRVGEGAQDVDVGLPVAGDQLCQCDHRAKSHQIARL